MSAIKTMEAKCQRNAIYHFIILKCMLCISRLQTHMEGDNNKKIALVSATRNYSFWVLMFDPLSNCRLADLDLNGKPSK